MRDTTPPGLVVGLVRVADPLMIACVGLIAYWGRFAEIDVPGNYAAVVMVGALLAANALHFFRVYEFADLTNLFSQWRKLCFAWPMAVLILLGVGFAAKMSADYSRIWAALWVAVSLIGMCAMRIVLRALILRWQRQGRFIRNVVVVGAGEHGQRLVRHVMLSRDPGVRIVGIFDDRRTRVPRDLWGHPVRGAVDDIVPFARRNRVDQIIVASPWSAEDRLLECIKKLNELPVDICLCPDTVAFNFPNRGVMRLSGVPMLKIFERPLTGWSHVVKTVEDKVLAASLLVLALPLMLLTALAIRMDSPGPVLFRQKRYGFNNETITVYKFRTMRVDLPHEDVWVRQARRNDPRVTRLGAFLRQTSLDELPQLLNVLKGDMSIVGPRPHAVAHNERYANIVELYLARHKVKPGITGWAQVNGFRGQSDDDQMRRRIEHDLFYIDNWSLSFDLRIIVLTLLHGFVHDNAY